MDKTINTKPLWRDVTLCLTAAWIGATIMFAGVVAPALFAVLPTRGLAGAVVGRVLPFLNVTGAIVGACLLIVSWRQAISQSAVTNKIISGGSAVLAASCLINEVVIGRRIARLRAQMPTALETLATNDALRVEFGRWHGISVVLLAIGLIASLTTAWLMIKKHRE